jgi:hypothetical protein
MAKAKTTRAMMFFIVASQVQKMQVKKNTRDRQARIVTGVTHRRFSPTVRAGLPASARLRDCVVTVPRPAYCR